MTRTVATGRTAATGRSVATGRPATSPRLGAYFLNPLTAIPWNAAYWANDPLYTTPGNGNPAASIRNGAVSFVNDIFLGDPGAVMPGVSANSVQIPDSAATSIAGDFSAAMLFIPPTSPPSVSSTIMGKRSGATTAVAWFVTWSTGNNLTLGVSVDGTTIVTTANQNSSWAGQAVPRWLKVEWRQSDGRVQWFQDAAAWNGTNDLPAAWTQLGTNKTAVVASIFDSTFPTSFGAADRGAGSSNVLRGPVKRALLWNGLESGGGATVQADLVLTGRAGQTQFVESSANAATCFVVGRRTLVPALTAPAVDPTYLSAGVNGRPTWNCNGTTQAIHSDALSTVTIANPSSVVAVIQFNTIAAALSYAIAPSPGVTRGIGHDAAGLWTLSMSTSLTAATGPTAGVPYLVRALVNGASSKLFVNEVEVASGNAGANLVAQMGFGAARSATAFASFADCRVPFCANIAGDVSADPQWANFVDFCRGQYGIAA